MSAAAHSHAKGLVSIIMPTYRRAEGARAAALSALAQTYADIEVVVVSDGPDEATRAAVESLDPRLRYVELPVNVGPAEARNAGVRASRGEWLMFLDDDDLMLPDKVERQLALADAAEPVRLIACRVIYRHDGRDDVWPHRPMRAGEDMADYLLLRPSLLGRPGVLTMQSLLVHRSLWQQVPFTTHPEHEDWAWLLEVAHLAGATVSFVWEPLVVYTIATDAQSRSRRLNWRDTLLFADRYRHWIGDRAYTSLLSTKVALKAKRADGLRGVREVARLVLRARPSLLDLAFLTGALLLPTMLLQAVWRRSLRAS